MNKREDLQKKSTERSYAELRDRCPAAYLSAERHATAIAFNLELTTNQAALIERAFVSYALEVMANV